MASNIGIRAIATMANGGNVEREYFGVTSEARIVKDIRIQAFGLFPGERLAEIRILYGITKSRRCLACGETYSAEGLYCPACEAAKVDRSRAALEGARAADIRDSRARS